MATRVTDGARRERNEKRETTRKARENGLFTVPFCLPFKFATSDIFGIFLSVPHSNRSHFGLIQSMGGGKYICHVFAEYKVGAWSHTI